MLPLQPTQHIKEAGECPALGVLQHALWFKEEKHKDPEEWIQARIPQVDSRGW